MYSQKFVPFLFRFSIASFLLIIMMPSSLIAQKKRPVTKNASLKIKEEPIQIVSYELLENGDTVNRLDNHKIQHGKWVIEHEAHYEEPGNIEVGSFDNGSRVGAWKTYSMQGIIQSEEFYKKGLKDGEARYYEDGYLICVGNYMALNQTKPYDTVMVEDPISNEYKPIRIKTETGSIRHGMWTFYEGRTKRITRVVEYQADDIIYDKSYNTMTKSDSVFVMSKIKSMPHISHKPDENVWMNKGGQKRIKYTDLPDNASYIKPNVRKK